MSIFNYFKKKTSTLKNSTGEVKMSTDSYYTERKVLTYYLAKSLIEEGERLDKKTLHKFTKDGVEMKYCMHCNRWLPLDRFSKNKNNLRDGLVGKCKTCVNADKKFDYSEKMRKHLSFSQAKSMLKEGERLDEKTLHKFTKDGIEMKYCVHCNRWLPLEKFNKQRSNPRDGLSAACKECRKENAEKKITSQDRLRTKKSINVFENAKPLIEEGGVYDETTYHVLTKDLVELKHCSHCGRWLPLNMYYKDNSCERDGLQCTCIECQTGKKAESLQRIRETKALTQSIGSNAIVDKFNEIKMLINKENDDLKQKLAKQEEEIKRLNAENMTITAEKNRYKELFDNCLAVFNKVGVKYDNGNVTIPDREISKEDIERYLETHNDITPRVLIGSLSRYDNRYRFYCKDTITGLTSPIVEEVYA